VKNAPPEQPTGRLITSSWVSRVSTQDGDPLKGVFWAGYFETLVVRHPGGSLVAEAQDCCAAPLAPLNILG
jgi:hypothetical protein